MADGVKDAMLEDGFELTDEQLEKLAGGELDIGYVQLTDAAIASYKKQGRSQAELIQFFTEMKANRLAGSNLGAPAEDCDEIIEYVKQHW